MKLLRAIVEGPYEPNDINVLWIDTSLDGVPVLRKYANGFWTYVSSSGTAFIVEVDTLPEASKQTLGKMYATPSENPHTGDTTDEWLTVVSYDADGIPSYSWEQIGQNPDLSQFITKSVDNLENYYLKSETYTQQEITDRINASKNLVYLVVDELPQASSETLNSIYLVEDSQQEDVYNMYITQYDESTTTYSWLNIGNTSIDLSLYATEAELATLQAEVDDVEDAVEELDEKKANKNGSYEQMSVGSAKNLEGKTLVSDAFFERTTGGSAELANGLAQIMEVSGNSQVWNQLVKNGDFSNGTTGWTIGASTSSVNSGILSVTTPTDTGILCTQSIGNNGHKFYGSAFVKATTNQVYFRIGNQSVYHSGSGSFERLTTLYNGLTSITNLTPQFRDLRTSDYDAVEIKNVVVLDLTLLGIDNLTTVAQVEAWLADNVGLQSYYPYNAGTILNNKLAGIESYGFNLLDPYTGKARIIGAYSDTYGNYYGITGTHGDITFVDYLGNSSTITPDTDGKFQLTVPGELTVASAGADCAVFFWWDGTKTEYEAYDKKTEYLDVTHIYGKLNGEGNLVQVFPNGMQSVLEFDSAQSSSTHLIQDLLKIEDDEAIAKVNVKQIVFTGDVTENWGTITDGLADDLIGYSINNAELSKDNLYIPNISHFKGVKGSTGFTIMQEWQGKHGSNSNSWYFIVPSSTFANVDAWKNWLVAQNTAGFPLTIEGIIATPVTYTNLVYQGSSYFVDGTPVTLPVNYQVNNWGIERLLPQNTTDSVTVTSPEVSMLYSIDAVEELDTHTTQIEELTTTVTGLGTDKADKDTDAVENNLAKFDDSGNPIDSGIAASYINQLGQEINGVTYSFSNTGYIGSSGAITATGGYSNTGFISVTPGQKFIYKGRIAGSNICVAGYSSASDSDFESALITAGTYTNDAVFVIPDDVTYIIACSADDTTHLLKNIDSIIVRVADLEAKQAAGDSGFGFPFNQSGKIHSSTGAIVADANYIHTNFIPVQEGEVLLYSANVEEGASLCGYLYADTSSFVSQLLGADNYPPYQEIIIPSGVRYIMAACIKTFENPLVARKTELSMSINGRVNHNSNGLYGCPFLGQGYIKSDGTITTSSGYHTDFVPVKQGDVYYYKGGIGASFLCVAGYSQKSTSSFVQSLLSGGNYTDYQKIVIPSGVSYIMACTRVGDPQVLVEESFLYKLIYEVVGHPLKNEYYGKTVNWLGDSIVAGDDFDELVSSYFEMTENDYGIGGSTIAKDTNNTRNSMAVRYSNMSNDADVIIVSGGTNDYQYSFTDFGQLGDTTETTFYGALDVLCRGLIAKYPSKLIFFTTPIKRNQDNNDGQEYTHYQYDTHQDIANSLGKTLKDYADAIKEVCAKYSIPVCDLYSESMLNPNMTAQKDYFDSIGTHPNSTGMAIMARRVRGFMKQLI